MHPSDQISSESLKRINALLEEMTRQENHAIYNPNFLRKYGPGSSQTFVNVPKCKKDYQREEVLILEKKNIICDKVYARKLIDDLKVSGDIIQNVINIFSSRLENEDGINENNFLIAKHGINSLISNLLPSFCLGEESSECQLNYCCEVSDSFPVVDEQYEASIKGKEVEVLQSMQVNSSSKNLEINEDDIIKNYEFKLSKNTFKHFKLIKGIFYTPVSVEDLEKEPIIFGSKSVSPPTAVGIITHVKGVKVVGCHRYYFTELLSYSDFSCMVAFVSSSVFEGILNNINQKNNDDHAEDQVLSEDTMELEDEGSLVIDLNNHEKLPIKVASVEVTSTKTEAKLFQPNEQGLNEVTGVEKADPNNVFDEFMIEIDDNYYDEFTNAQEIEVMIRTCEDHINKYEVISGDTAISINSKTKKRIAKFFISLGELNHDVSDKLKKDLEKLPKKYIHHEDTLSWLPVVILGPNIYDDFDKEKESPRNLYCSSCEVVTLLNPAKNVSGFLQHVRKEHVSNIVEDLPDIDTFAKSFNQEHMGSVSLNFIVGVKFIGRKVSHPGFFKEYNKNSSSVLPENLASFFVNSLNVRRKSSNNNPSKRPSKKRKLENDEAFNTGEDDNEDVLLSKILPTDRKVEFSAFPLHISESEVVLQVALEVPSCYLKEGIQYITTIFKNKDATHVEGLDLSDLSHNLRKTKTVMKATNKVIFSSPEVRSSVNKVVKPDNYFSQVADVKRFAVYANAPKLEYNLVVESLKLTGRLFTFPVYRSKCGLYQDNLQSLFIKDYERLQQILRPYVKDVKEWAKRIHENDEEYSKINLAIEEMRKIVEDHSLVGFSLESSKHDDNPWNYQVPLSVSAYSSINSFLRCVHLVL